MLLTATRTTGVFTFSRVLANEIQSNCRKTVRAFRAQLPEKNDFFDKEDNPTPLWNTLDTKNQLVKIGQLKKGNEILTYELSVNEFQEINRHNDDPEELLSIITNHSLKKDGSMPNKNSSSDKIEGSENDMDIDDDDDDDHGEEPVSDHLFLIYKLNMIQDYDQILRYCFSKNSRPLFYSSKGLFDHQHIPKCERCGAERIFEFQINNTLLNYHDELKDLDWGVLCVYSCSQSCFGENITEFAEETVLIQREIIETGPQPDVAHANAKAEQELARLLIEEMSLESQQMSKKNMKKPKEVEKPKKKDLEFDEDDWN
jgi:hypothetical protein